jgi:3-phenylpropionate/cinnamic acid dioxygenase small subunit
MTSAASAELVTELTQLLYHEATLLDSGRYEDWLALLADDVEYLAPIRPEVDPSAERRGGSGSGSSGAVRHELAYFSDGIDLLRLRVAKIRTGLLQSENPPSRTVRLVSNVQVGDRERDGTRPVSSAFLLYRHRRQRQVEILAGHRHDRWRRTDHQWRLTRREVLFAANVLPTKSLSLFY